MNTKRIAIVSLSVPAEVSDQAFADQLWKVMRQALKSDDDSKLWPDPQTLEVVVHPAPDMPS